MAKRFLCTSAEPIVQTKAGKLRGYMLDSTYTFHGIEYASAERFQMPRPVQPWEGVKDALNYGHIAPLLDTPAPTGELMIPHRFWPENEHCQYLNVWTQSLDQNAKKPVMVWLHGGGFSAGSSIEQVAYDGDNLSTYGDVVVVTLNHRLNILGFLDMSSYGEKYANSGNAGMADIVEALRWVQDNIANFGGDPNNVTVFGQSGGGMKATALCQIPSATGLFHKAIVMSGIADLPMGGNRDDKVIVKAVLNELELNENDVEKLEKLPFAILAKAYNKAEKKLRKQGTFIMWGPLPNDWYTGDPFQVGFSENAKKIPTMAGTVIAEFAFGANIPQRHSLSAEERYKIVSDKFGDHADRLIGLFKKAYPNKNEVDVLLVDGMFRKPTLKYLEQKSAVAEAPVYSYMFALEFDCDDGRPAWHCSDIPFVFHNTDKVAVCNMDGVTERLEEQVFRAYVNFARYGNPNHDSLPQWPAFTPENKATMILDRECEVRVDYEAELLDLLAAVNTFDLSQLAAAMDNDDETEEKAWLY